MRSKSSLMDKFEDVIHSRNIMHHGAEEGKREEGPQCVPEIIWGVSVCSQSRQFLIRGARSGGQKCRPSATWSFDTAVLNVLSSTCDVPPNAWKILFKIPRTSLRFFLWWTRAGRCASLLQCAAGLAFAVTVRRIWRASSLRG